jgi:hypothetical protein
MSIQKFTSTEKVIAALIILSIVLIKWSEYFVSPSKLLPSGGDGTKNYFTFLYHVKHDSTYWKFEGMNYPFGENIVFTDNQPLWVVFTKWIHSLVGLSDGAMIAFHNWAILIGLALGSLGIFFVLRKLQTGTVFALFCTVGLMFLQPQLDRMQSHYSMVYPFLPWVFYGWLHIWENHKIKQYSLALSLLVLTGGLLHMYHFLTMAVCIGLAGILYLLQNRNIKGFKTLAAMWGIQIIVPFGILFLLSNFILPVPDRPVKVWGFFSYHSAWEGLFFSYKLPLFQYINEHITKIRTLDHIEGVNYIGWVSAAFVLLSIPVLVFKFFRFLKNKNFSFTPRTNLAFIFIFSALISFGLPFTIKGLGWLLDYTGPFQQFRSIGRIGWISFYAINFISLSWLYEKISAWKYKIPAYLTLVIIGTIVLYEGYYTIPLNQNPPELQGAFTEKLSDIPIDTKKYQALLPDPYLHGGAECFGWGPSGGNQDQVFQVGFKLGMPSMASIMSRTSLKQSAMLNQLVCKPYDVPEIIRVLKNKDNRPILVLESTLDLWHRNSSLSHWTKNTQIVYEGQGFRLRELPLNHFNTIVAAYRDSLATIQTDTLSNKPLVFDHSPKDKTWGHEVVLQIDENMKGDNLFLMEVVYKENTDVNAIFECWQYADSPDHIHHFSLRIHNHIKRMKDGKLYIEVPVHIASATKKMSVRLSKDRQKKNEILPFKNARLVKVVLRQ